MIGNSSVDSIEFFFAQNITVDYDILILTVGCLSLQILINNVKLEILSIIQRITRSDFIKYILSEVMSFFKHHHQI